jgi:hypothetical protein
MEVDEIMLKSQQAIFKLLEKREPVVLVGENDMSILELMSRQSDSVMITMFPKLNEKEISEVNYEVSIKLACSYIQIKLEMEKYLCFDLIQFIHDYACQYLAKWFEALIYIKSVCLLLL